MQTDAQANSVGYRSWHVIHVTPASTSPALQILSIAKAYPVLATNTASTPAVLQEGTPHTSLL
jgi:hypothetical protein